MEERKIYEIIDRNIHGINLIKLTEEQYKFLKWVFEKTVSNVAIIQPGIYEPPC